MRMTDHKQFFEDFAPNSRGVTQWSTYAGDGSVTVDFQAGKSHRSILVDASVDQRNVWWALIRGEVTAGLDLARLSQPGYELRAEACIRSSHAPRRVNLHLCTQRTTDHHSHMMEFDIPDTTNWHRISMTTRGFDFEPGDQIFGQLALMYWGLWKYCVDVAYYRVDVVDSASAEADFGEQTPYHPPVPAPDAFAHQLAVAQDSMIDVQYPNINFDNWGVHEADAEVKLLTVNRTQLVILRWALEAFAGKRVAAGGLLELTTHSVQRCFGEHYKFGKIRVSEILHGEPYWRRECVTLQSLCQGRPLEEVINTQMIDDALVNEVRDGKTYVTISHAVLQRLVGGATLGLCLRPLGAINASFFTIDNGGEATCARLLFNLAR